jgi:hypothetical protein
MRANHRPHIRQNYAIAAQECGEWCVGMTERGCRSGQPEQGGGSGGLAPVGNAELAEDARQMALHGAGTDEEGRRDLLVGPALDDEGEDLPLAERD